MRRISAAALLAALLAAGVFPVGAALSAPSDRPPLPASRAAVGTPVRLDAAERAALDELLTFFFRYAGTELPESRNDDVLIRLGTEAVFRHYAMDGMESCAPTNDPDREDGFLLSPRCVDAAVMRLSGYALAAHRSVGDRLYTEAGYSVPLPVGEPPTAAVTDKVFRLADRRYRVDGYCLRYQGPAVEENALESSHAFTAVLDRRDGRWRLRSLRTDARPRPTAVPLRLLRPDMDRDMLLLLGGVPVDDAQALWLRVGIGDLRWRGRVRLRRDKAVSAVLETAARNYDDLDALLRGNGFLPTELLRGRHRQRPAGPERPGDAWNALVKHFYAALGTPDPEPAQLVYTPQAASGGEAEAREAFPQLRLEPGETPRLIIQWR